MYRKKKSKIISILLTLAMLIMLWPGAAYALAPGITGSELDSDNVRIRVTFSEAVYANSDGTGGVTADDFTLNFAQNGGAVTNVTTSGPRTLQNGDPTGGETSFFFYLNVANGPASGLETVEIKPRDGASVYNSAGEAMPADATTGAITLNDKRIEFLTGYPQAGNPQEAGSRQMRLVIKATETVYHYFVVVANDAPAPSKDQVMNGKDAAGNPALAVGSSGNNKYSEIDTGAFTQKHDTDYDFWVVIKDGAGNTTNPVKVDAKTPPAANFFAAGYPQTGVAQADASRDIQILVKTQNTQVNAKVYYVLVADGANAPSIEQISERKDSTGSAALAYGNIECEKNNEYNFLVKGLADNTPYDLYLVAGDTRYFSPITCCTDAVKLDVTTPPAVNVCEIVGGTQYETLDAALGAVAEGQTIKLLANVTDNNGIELSWKKFTLDLNGKSLNINNLSGTGLALELTSEMNVIGSGNINISSEMAGLNVNESKFITAAPSIININSTNGAGVYADTSCTIAINGNVSGLFGVYASNNNVITVTGTVTAVGSNANHHAVMINYPDNTVSVGSAIVSSGLGSGVCFGDSGSGAVIVGSQTTPGQVIGKGCGIWTRMNPATVTVYGNVKGTSKGIFASDKSNITVHGDVTSTGSAGSEYGVYGFTNSDASSIIIEGDVTGPNGVCIHGAQSEVRVTGDVTATGTDNDDNTGVRASYARLFVTGNVTAANCTGAYSAESSEITVDGTISAVNYIKVKYNNKAIGDNDTDSTKSGYLQYSSIDAYVWVKEASSDTTAPTIPANLRMTGRTSSSISLAWDAAADNVGVVQYLAEMKPSGGNWTQIGTPAATSFSKTGLAAATTYLFRVKAMDAAGNASAWSNELSATTLSAGSNGGGGSSSAPSGIQVTPAGQNVTEGSVSLSFPTGAVENDIRVQVKEASLTSGMTLPDDSRLISRVVDIIKDKSGNFSKPVTINMSFDKSNIDPDQYDIKICYFDEASGKWVDLDNIEVNLTAGTVSGQVTHFTKFAVIATLKAPEKEQPPLPPAPQPPPALPKDIAAHWAKDNIVKLINAGVISGYPDGSFKPDKTITRAEFAVMLAKALKLPSQSGATFADTSAHWAKESIAAAAARGIISGYDQNTFGPDHLITREQMAVMAVKAGQFSPADSHRNFTDQAKISAWAKDAVNLAAAHAVLKGYSDQSFRPQSPATRAEAVSVISKLMP